ncbi:MAG: hypothetical protein Q7R95_01780 [bacterium]|nr:hypothetical protein [bacterium]
MKHILKNKILIAAFIIGVCSLFYTSTASAQSTINLTVIPPRQELNMQPGETTRIQIKFYNKTDEPVSGSIKTADFLVLDNLGTPTLFDTSTANNRFAASQWITPLENRATIAANSQYVSYVTIKVPKDAYPCGKYTSVYFEPTPPLMGGQSIKVESASTVAFKLSSLIYLNIEGVCKENAYVSKISAPRFMEYGPIPVEVGILNRSDYHITPQVGVSLLDLFNNEKDLKPLVSQNIFPDTIRSYKSELGSKWMFGRYQVDISGGYGKTGKTLHSFTYVWVFPWKLMILIILTIIFIIILIKSLLNKISKKTEFLEKEIDEEKAEIEKLRDALKKRKD